MLGEFNVQGFNIKLVLFYLTFDETFFDYRESLKRLNVHI